MSNLMRLYHGSCNVSGMKGREGKTKKITIEHAVPSHPFVYLKDWKWGRLLVFPVNPSRLFCNTLSAQTGQICVDLNSLIFKWDIRHSPSPHFAPSTWALGIQPLDLGVDTLTLFSGLTMKFNFLKLHIRYLKTLYGAASATNTEGNPIVPIVHKPSRINLGWFGPLGHC